MLELSYIRNNRSVVKQGLMKRNWQPENLVIVDEIIQLDDTRKENQTRLDSLSADLNRISKEIGDLYKKGETDQAGVLKQQVPELKQQIKLLEKALNSVKIELETKLLDLPNTPHEWVPAGNSEEDNFVYKAWEGKMPELSSDAIPHWELADKYNLFNFKLGVKLTGAGFPVYRGQGARLERALINFFLDEAMEAGYVEYHLPLLVNADSAKATGQLPDKEGQMYHVTKDDLYLIPTAEVPITNIFRNDIVDKNDFPIKLTGYTPCFRREAGSYGAHVKGLNRVHQFDKVEIVQIQHPEKSWESLDHMIQHVENILVKLELPYRILRLCGGDLGFTSAMTYDFEVFSAAQKKWLEVSSVSNFLTFQSNRLKLRYRDDKGKTQLVHTLNGSALALARIVAALLENNQMDAGIRIPKALVKYTGFEFIQV